MPFDANDLILIAKSLGFGRVGIVNLDADQDQPPQFLKSAMAQYRAWLSKGFAGGMDYLSAHADIREQPARLMALPVTTLRAVVVTMDYLPVSSQPNWRDSHTQRLADPSAAVISLYAHGRDYHKVLRQRLVQLADRLQDASQSAHETQSVANSNTSSAATALQRPYQFRACVDSAPVLEVELARRCGLGWRGKHTLLLNREQGSMFFLGVLLTDMPLDELAYPAIQAESSDGHCGTCTACLTACPTSAFIGPYQLDARRCISYLTIELKSSIPIELRPLIGNRVYGCDDCQQACPWNQFAQVATVPDFDVRNGLDHAQLIALFGWTEDEFRERHQGSAILRIGHVQWLRNLAVAMGNSLAKSDCPAPIRQALVNALSQRCDHPSEMVREHVAWALARSTE
jgi:epoxyqueuosine reductase